MITLTNGAVECTVGSELQAEQLEARGFRRVSGTASTSIVKGTYPYVIEDTTELMRPGFRGVGVSGEADDSLITFLHRCMVDADYDEFKRLSGMLDCLYLHPDIGFTATDYLIVDDFDRTKYASEVGTIIYARGVAEENLDKGIYLTTDDLPWLFLLPANELPERPTRCMNANPPVYHVCFVVGTKLDGSQGVYFWMPDAVDYENKTATEVKESLSAQSLQIVSSIPDLSTYLADAMFVLTQTDGDYEPNFYRVVVEGEEKSLVVETSDVYAAYSVGSTIPETELGSLFYLTQTDGELTQGYYVVIDGEPAHWEKQE